MNNDPLGPARAVQVQVQVQVQTQDDYIPVTTNPQRAIASLPSSSLLSLFSLQFSTHHGTLAPATSEGGSGYSAPDTFFPPAQQPQPHPQRPIAPANPGPSLIDQSLDGGPLSSELQDAAQDRDPRSREAFAHAAAERDFGGALSNPNPYGV